MSKNQSNAKWFYRLFVVIGAGVAGTMIGVLWMQNSYSKQLQAAAHATAQAETSLAKAIGRIESLRHERDAAKQSATEWESKANHHQQLAQAWQQSSQTETARADSLQQACNDFEVQLRDCNTSLEGCRKYRTADRKAFTLHLERSDSALQAAQQRILVLEDVGDQLNYFFSWLWPRKKASPPQQPEPTKEAPIRFTHQNASEASLVVLDGSLNGYQARAKFQARSLELVAIAFGLWKLLHHRNDGSATIQKLEAKTLDHYLYFAPTAHQSYELAGCLHL